MDHGKVGQKEGESGRKGKEGESGRRRKKGKVRE